MILRLLFVTVVHEHLILLLRIYVDLVDILRLRYVDCCTLFDYYIGPRLITFYVAILRYTLMRFTFWLVDLRYPVARLLRAAGYVIAVDFGWLILCRTFELHAFAITFTIYVYVYALRLIYVTERTFVV